MDIPGLVAAEEREISLWQGGRGENATLGHTAASSRVAKDGHLPGVINTMFPTRYRRDDVPGFVSVTLPYDGGEDMIAIKGNR